MIHDFTRSRRLVSASDTSLWVLCPRAFYYQKVLKIPTLPTENLVRGKIIHKTYSEFFRGLFKSTNLEEYYATFLNQKILEIVENFNKSIKQLELDKDKLIAETREKAEKLIFRVKYGFNSIPKYLETTFTAKGLVARPDSIFENNGSLNVADIKLDGNDGIGTRFQLAVGAIVVEEELNKPVKNGVIIDGQEWNEKIIPITNDMKKLVFEIRDNILDFCSKPYLPKVEYNPYKCDNCSFRHLCKLNGGEDNGI